MPSGLEHPAYADADKPGIFKGLVVGETGVGKSGMLASLLDDGYKIRVLDFDAGVDPVIGYVRNKANLANLNYVTLRDEFKIAGSYVKVNKAPAFQHGMALLEGKQEWEEFGAVETWGPDCILVLDTLGSAAKSSFNMVLQANGIVQPSGNRGGPEQSHYGTAQDNVERILMNLTNPNLVPCHVIVNAHWTYQEVGTGLVKPYPETIGKALNPTVGRKFNNQFSVSIKAGERLIHVVKDGMIACKSSKPLKKETYGIKTGMSEIFKEIVGSPPMG